MQAHRVRLDSWKGISAELGVSDRTARRYEIQEGLPVHRHLHKRRASVYAWSDELQSWKQNRSTAAAGVPRHNSPDGHYANRTDQTTVVDKAPTEDVAGPWREPVIQQHPLIGRDEERDLILRALDAARSGRGSMVLIGGEAGIGKTHLVRAILAEAATRNCFALVGHCRDMEGAPPYVAFVEMLEYCSRFAPRDAFRRSLGDSAAEVARLVPGLRQVFDDIPAPVELPSEQQRRFLFNAYCDFVERSACLRPIVALFEDLQWADEAALLLLTHLARRVSSVPVLLLATYRSADADTCGPLAQFLEGCFRDKSISRFQLRPLGLPALRALLDHLSGQTTPDELVSFVFDQSEGNPLFAEELFFELRVDGKLFDGRGACRAFQGEHAPVPPKLRLIIGRRLNRLKEETRRLLKMAAIIGRSFSIRLLEALESVQGDPMLDALDEAQRAQLIEPDETKREPTYRFTHELVRQTVIESLSPPRRQRLHALVAKALEGLFAGNLESQASTLAHHHYQGGAAVDLGQTIGYLVLAARAATSSAAHEEALVHIERALALAQSERQSDIADLVVCRAAALRSLSRTAEAIEAYELSIELFSAAERFAEIAEASLSLGYIHLWRADPGRACAVVHRAVKPVGLGATLPRYRLQLLNAASLGVKGEMEAAFGALKEARHMALVLAEASANDIGFAHLCEAHIYYFAAQIKAAAQSARAAVAEFRATGNRWAEVDAYEVMSDTLWLGGASGSTDTLLAELLCRAEQVGHWNVAWTYRFMLAETLVHRGKLEEAERSAREVHDFGTAISCHWAFLDYVLLAAIAHYRGKLEAAAAWSRRGLEAEPESYMSGQLNGCLFWNLAAQRNPAAEDALISARAHLPVEGRIMTIGSSSCLSFVIEGLAIAGRREEAAGLESRAEWAVANGPFWLYTRHLFRTSAGIAAACARNWARAEEHHQIAIHIADDTECRVAQPVCRYWYADMLFSRDMSGDRQKARELLSEALSLCKGTGMVWHAHSAATLLLRL